MVPNILEDIVDTVDSEEALVRSHQYYLSDDL
jgi:hypothetical protein